MECVKGQRRYALSPLWSSAELPNRSLTAMQTLHTQRVSRLLCNLWLTRDTTLEPRPLRARLRPLCQDFTGSEGHLHQGLLGIPFVLEAMIERNTQTLRAGGVDRLEFHALFINCQHIGVPGLPAL